MTEKNKQEQKSRQSKSESDRAMRLAAELRANLKKRKDHMRETKKLPSNKNQPENLG